MTGLEIVDIVVVFDAVSLDHTVVDDRAHAFQRRRIDQILYHDVAVFAVELDFLLGHHIGHRPKNRGVRRKDTQMLGTADFPVKGPRVMGGWATPAASRSSSPALSTG